MEVPRREAVLRTDASQVTGLPDTLYGCVDAQIRQTEQPSSPQEGTDAATVQLHW